jgi:predicted nuclease of restriction endonuclease-like (RecB) superfamily
MQCFLTVSKKAHEREIERGLLIHLRDLLLELGRGFSFVGSQVPLEVGGETFYCRFANYLAHSCSDYLAHYRSWRVPVIPRSA